MIDQKQQPSQAVSAAAYLPFGGRKNIGQEAARPRPDFVTLSWASGLPAFRPAFKDGQPVIDELSGEHIEEAFTYAGFFCNVDEDEDLDAALTVLGTPQIEISHQEGRATHWIFSRAAFYLLAEGLQSKVEMKQSVNRLGVAYGWRTNKAGREESYLYAQVMPRQLLGRYNKPFVLAVKSTQTEDALKIFYRQYGVLASTHAYLKSVNADLDLPLWSIAHGIGPAKKPESRGQKGRTREIYPMVSLAPERLSLEQVPDHLKKFEAPEQYLEALHTWSAQSVSWSTELVARIAAENDPFAIEPGAGGGR